MVRGFTDLGCWKRPQFWWEGPKCGIAVLNSNAGESRVGVSGRQLDVWTYKLKDKLSKNLGIIRLEKPKSMV